MSNLQDFKINIRLKLSALWISVMFCYIYGDYFELYLPKKVESLLSGQNNLDSPFKLLFTTIILAIPAVMIFLSLELRPKIARILNIFIGLFFTLFTFFVGLISISEWRMFYLFLTLLESFLTILIVIYACKWPKNS